MDFEAVYREHFQYVYRFLLSLCHDAGLAEELTQDVFDRALRKSNQFKGQCEPRTWLCSIARNCYFDERRYRKREQTADISENEKANWFGAWMNHEEALIIHQALHALDEPYKEVFTLRVFGELEHREIGALFGKSENWSRVTFYRAKTKLQELVGKENRDE